MSTPTTPQGSVAWYIDRFITDTGLAHDFVKGDDTVMVVGEEGSYPSLAKLAKDALAAIQLLSETRFAGLTVRTYQFPAQKQVSIQHNLNTTLFEIFIKNSDGDIVWAPYGPVDNNNLSVTFTEPESGIMVVKYYDDPTLAVPQPT